jgi:hypothetical protein
VVQPDRALEWFGPGMAGLYTLHIRQLKRPAYSQKKEDLLTEAF